MKEVRAGIAKAHGVSIGRVKMHTETHQTGVAKEDGVHVYNADGRKVGVVNQPIYEKMVNVQDQIQRRRIADKRAGRHFGGLRFNSTVYPAFKNAHDPGFGNLKDTDGKIKESTAVGISRSMPDGMDGTIRVSATDGKTYSYNSMNLSLLSIEDTRN